MIAFATSPAAAPARSYSRTPIPSTTAATTANNNDNNDNNNDNKEEEETLPARARPCLRRRGRVIGLLRYLAAVLKELLEDKDKE